MKFTLPRQNIAAWLTVILSFLGLALIKPPNRSGIVFVSTFFGGLIWALVSTIRLRKSGRQKTEREKVLLRVVFLLILTGVFGYLGLKSWYFILAASSLASAILLWRLSPAAQYPLYLTTFLVTADFGTSFYEIVRQPELSVGNILGGSAIALGVTALLINCCLYVRRLAKITQQPNSRATLSYSGYLSFARTRTGGTVQIDHGPPSK